jgi:hypothetical protein
VRDFFKGTKLDEFDRAQEQEQKIRDAELEKRKILPRKLPLTGWCWNNCGTETGGVFCSLECGQDYYARQDAERRNK